MSLHLEDRLRSHLQEQALGLQPDAAGVDAAVGDGRRMRRRRMALNSVVAVLLLVVGVGGAVAVRAALVGDPEADLPLADANEPGTVNAVGGGPITSGSALATLNWYGVEPTVGYSTKLFGADDGAIYALSTAPGATWQNAGGGPPPKALYRTDDGETWSVTLIAGEFGLSDIDESKGTLYAIGTAPGFSAVGASAAGFTVSTSKDGGETWETSLLPSVATPPDDLGNVNWVDATANIAAGESRTVAATFTRYQVDLFGLLPAEVRSENVDVQPTDTGIQAIDYSIYEQLSMQCEQETAALGGGDPGELAEDQLPDSCRQLFSGQPADAIVFTATWEELGFDNGSPLSFSELFVASDGGAFEPVPSPFRADEWVRGIYAVGDGFMSLSWGLNSAVVRFSPDGRTWNEVSGLAGISDVMQVGSYGGLTVVAGATGETGRPVIAASVDGTTWTTADIDEVLDELGGELWMSAAAIGEQGVVFTLQWWDEVAQRSSTTMVRGNGVDQWEIVPLQELIGAGDAYVEWLAVGREHIVGRVVLSSQFGPPTGMQLVGLPSE
jgi:hypothetical protein